MEHSNSHVLNLHNSNDKQHTYQTFNQVKAVIVGVEPIDHFFAKEMITALVFNNAVALPILSDETLVEGCVKGVEEDSKPAIAQLTHLFLALSMSLRSGHACLPLSQMADKHWARSYAKEKAQVETSEASAELFLEVSLTQAEQISQPTQVNQVGFKFAPIAALQQLLTPLNIDANNEELLVLEGGNLYLRRYYQFESQLASFITERLAQEAQYDHEEIEHCIEALFPSTDVINGNPAMEIDWQKVAVANAINKNFSVIAGGPGTGKTYTVTKLLAALIMLQESTLAAPHKTGNDLRLNIALVAPTGKAAQRLSESIVAAISGFSGLISEQVLNKIPCEAQTVHRLLGVIPNSPNFRHHQDKKLPYDVVLIDEVSMVDLPLMTRIFRALKPTAKVILLGDADQLPSVAAGSVLADIAPRPHIGYSVQNTKYLNQICMLEESALANAFNTLAKKQSTVSQRESLPIDYLTFLVKSRRFDGLGGIGLLATSVINGDTHKSWQLLKATITTNIEQGDQPSREEHFEGVSQARSIQESKCNALTLAQGELSTWLTPLVKQYYQPIEHCTTVKEAFALFAKFRVLCATRQGQHGVEQINVLIQEILGKNTSFAQHNHAALYHGQPIMINENDYRLGLYNGDIGIVWRVTDAKGKTHLMACFEQAELSADSQTNSHNDTKTDSNNALAGTRQILPTRLPHYESVYAMTIHKTQGSEFAHVAMAISPTESISATSNVDNTESVSKLLSRELLYTGITRAKQQLTIASNKKAWQQGVTAKVQRHSGLRLENNL